MSADLTALVASTHWRWMPGMFDSFYCLRIVCVFDDDTAVWAGDERLRTHFHLSKSVPDLDDPATLGCLLALVREAHGTDAEICVYQDNTVHIEWPDGWDEFPDLTAALLAAPAKDGGS